MFPAPIFMTANEGKYTQLQHTPVMSKLTLLRTETQNVYAGASCNIITMCDAIAVPLTFNSFQCIMLICT